MATFVNVVGANDTPENLSQALSLGFDYIQTDHPRVLLKLLRERGGARGKVAVALSEPSGGPASVTTSRG
jgi:hypothetical protein